MSPPGQLDCIIAAFDANLNHELGTWTLFFAKALFLCQKPSMYCRWIVDGYDCAAWHC